MLVVCFGLTFVGWHDSVVAAAWKFVHLRRSAVAAIACKLTRVLCMGCGVAGADPPDPLMSTWPALTCGGCWQRGFSHEWASHPRHHPRSAAALPDCVPGLENHQYPLKKEKKSLQEKSIKEDYWGKKEDNKLIRKKGTTFFWRHQHLFQDLTPWSNGALRFTLHNSIRNSESDLSKFLPLPLRSLNPLLELIPSHDNICVWKNNSVERTNLKLWCVRITLQHRAWIWWWRRTRGWWRGCWRRLTR